MAGESEREDRRAGAQGRERRAGLLHSKKTARSRALVRHSFFLSLSDCAPPPPPVPERHTLSHLSPWRATMVRLPADRPRPCAASLSLPAKKNSRPPLPPPHSHRLFFSSLNSRPSDLRAGRRLGRGRHRPLRPGGRLLQAGSPGPVFPAAAEAAAGRGPVRRRRAGHRVRFDFWEQRESRGGTRLPQRGARTAGVHPASTPMRSGTDPLRWRAWRGASGGPAGRRAPSRKGAAPRQARCFAPPRPLPSRSLTAAPLSLPP